ncbi:uncharacterized protein LOC110997453 isoform X2 [Pieris rapae]|uniref:uncharacterized protein LOC110997453 isoform X2 n=1 Tax=Pieris rapae TaxID=64459 RepID=UPI001E27C981|nr:uncharacterized protein LOC110997453 isoform X2 [Pieris rapae]
MSIPPLVCSTPPPPDQCEDDKHIDEFDLQYRLSPEDEDENDEYNYGNFHNFHDAISNNEDSEPQIETCNIKTDHSNIGIIEHSKHSPSNQNSIDKASIDDVAIEDLNLKVEQESDLVDQIESNNSNLDEDSDTYGITCFTPHIESPNKSTLCINSNVVTEESNKVNEVETVIPELNDLSLFSEKGEEFPVKLLEQSESNIVKNQVLIENITSQCEESKQDLKTCDDFDDFEDFKFSTNSNYNIIESTGNPWESKDQKDFNFGDFKANFDVNESLHEELHNEKLNDEIINSQAILDDSQKLNEEIINSQAVLDESQDEDFGDFDDFKSSVNKEIEEHASQHVTVLTFQSNDNEGQIIESIKNILLNIFPDDLPDSETAFDGNLESLLGETWHHLKEIDVRQPYIVYWNNSLSQKTLLKALCIDSRNILFGPKWNSLMPKYATNLSGAPLKPQKPTTPQEPDLSAEKSKENITWTDPFTSTGQGYLEHLMTTLDQMAHKQSTLKISELLSTANSSDREKALKESRPADLNVFGSSITVSKLDKIHSSTLSVQPLRHINLPDTHIFTPTDSETPRSKTIHYDITPPVLLPQTIENHSIDTEKPIPKNTTIENNDDYWEFQDFKGTAESDQNVDMKTETINPNAGMILQSQLLQPVKVEPTIPTLNWPDPGEVKETFDDFSDFVSSTAWNNDNASTMEGTSHPPSASFIRTLPSDNVEDEFETFQSAPTPASNQKCAETLSPETSKFGNEITHTLPSDTLNIGPNQVFAPNTVQNHNISVDITSKSSPVNTSILKPINAGSTVIRPQKAGQILQPLSLESYSQINWPKPGIDLQNLSSFNPLESFEAFKSDSGSSGASKGASPVHKIVNNPVTVNETLDDDIWGDFVSSKPGQVAPKKQLHADEDEWTDFVSSPSISQNSLKTISYNVATNSTMQKMSNQSASKNNQLALEIPVLNYITPNSNSRSMCVDKHFQNL